MKSTAFHLSSGNAMSSCTIVIPTHNRDDLLIRAVCSALKSCPPDGEVLVVDDKSIVPAGELLSGLNDQRLRVLLNTGMSGAAHSRNFGVASAEGSVIFFLDDDDEMLETYCAEVLSEIACASIEMHWGFSSSIERRGNSTKTDTLRARKRLKRGFVPLSARPKDLVAAMSDGFWIRKRLFLELGGLDPEQTIDEDTDLCLRLLAASKQPWYQGKPGMIVHRGYVPARSEGAQLTVATAALRGLDCYRRTYDKNAGHFGSRSATHWYLATRYLRRAIKHGQAVQARAFLGSIRPIEVRIALRAFVELKLLVHSKRASQNRI
ncbi:glycosyltransferase like 2 family protein [Hydrogenophaga sp. RAC07]|uniref:glycosyltransferase family 2 protein n=1 Tax=Hydrogenophaga sp. RAC07 TaxID=1842537 RepID=UPI0008582865|nr:glycosyltransferase [Hydrogenophaga sp. RAC07]AOF86758.1 glycosyltransferase like 2 family protein [Hydrogenophaga sp. RAC07]